MKKRFIPEPLGRLVTTFLVGYFKKYVEYDFTAALETELDEVAVGQLDWKQLLGNFWQGFNGNINAVSEQKITDIISYIEQSLTSYLFGSDHTSTTARQCPSCKDGQLHLRLGKFGAFLACDHYPECNFKKSLTATNVDSDATKLEQDNNKDNNNRLIGQDSVSGLDIYLKKGPYGWYVQLGEVLSKLEKPKRAPLPSIIDPHNLKLDIAQKLLNLPLKIGEYPGSNPEIMLGIGKYGPYLKHDNAFCSIPKSLDPFNITVEQAVEIINANKIKNSNKQKITAKK